MFFFFKQKTAYEMRISDWSSDVCSSDLASDALYPAFALGKDGVAESSMSPVRFCSCGPAMTTTGPILSRRSDLTGFASTPTTYLSCLSGRSLPTRPQSAPTIRSEEHTSELQSLMRISYAVFCLKQNTVSTFIFDITVTLTYLLTSYEHTP